MEEATSRNPAREKEAKAYHQRRKEKQESTSGGDSWFELSTDGKKVLKKTKTATATHSVYVGTRKEADEKGIKYKAPNFGV